MLAPDYGVWPVLIRLRDSQKKGHHHRVDWLQCLFIQLATIYQLTSREIGASNAQIPAGGKKEAGASTDSDRMARDGQWSL